MCIVNVYSPLVYPVYHYDEGARDDECISARLLIFSMRKLVNALEALVTIP